MTSPPAEVRVRDAVPSDLPGITAIYAQAVLTGTGTFETTPPTQAEMAERLAVIEALGLPRLVADVDGEILGYAYVSPFRTRPAYRYTVEDSVYLAPSAMGRGLGRTLLERLIVRCQALGLQQMLAVIGDADNAASIRLHAACGFERIGTMTAVGWKFDRWLDVVFMQRALGNVGRAPPTTPGLPL